MSSFDKDFEIAQIALEGNNYEEAYRKYSEIIDAEISVASAWIGKGVSAAHLTSYEKIRFKECLLCLQKASEYNYDNSQNTFIAKEIVESASHYVDVILKQIDKIMLQKENAPMGTNQLYASKKFQDENAHMSLLMDHSKNYVDAVKFASEADKYDNSNEIQKLKLKLNLIDKIYLSSKKQIEYKYKELLDEEEKKIISKVKLNDPNFDRQTNLEKFKSEGCFIATATYGDYSHPQVIEFRNFRDNILAKNVLGILFIKMYYLISPFFAKIIKKSYLLQRIIHKGLLAPILKLINKSYRN